MENQEKFISLETNPNIVDLEDHGYTQAGISQGQPIQYKAFLASIFAGNLLDKGTFRQKTEEETRNIQEQINSAESKINEADLEIEENRTRISTHKEEHSKLEKLRRELLNGEISENGVSDQIDVFNRINFFVTSFFLVALSAFIFLFYVAVVYKALFVSTKSIALSIKSGQWGVSLLPSWYEVQTAISSNLMVLFAPFIFFGFGYVIHIFLKQKSNIKYFYISMVIGVTFLLDYLLADEIHKKVNQAHQLIGQTSSEKFSDVLIVLIMGFVVYIIWSVIFNEWIKELSKLSIPNNIGRQMKSLMGEIKDLNVTISELEKNKNKLQTERKQLRASIEMKSVAIGEIHRCLRVFTTGWFAYVTGRNNPELLSNCETTLNEFLRSNRIEGTNIYSKN